MLLFLAAVEVILGNTSAPAASPVGAAAPTCNLWLRPQGRA